MTPTDALLPAGYRLVTVPAGSGAHPVQLGAAGSAGAVYLAVDEALGRQVAVKVVEHRRAAGRWSSSAPVHEARTLAQLDHPHVVRVYDLVRHDAVDVIVMELVDGATLAELIGADEPGRAHRLRLIAQAADGLGYLHRAGLVHRDVKPANVLVSRDGAAKLADFGLVTAADLRRDPLAHEVRQSVAGTPGYWSPEQSRGGPVGPPSDVYALALVAGQLLDGLAPARPARRGPSIEAVIRKSLDPDPGRRPADGGELHARGAPPPTGKSGRGAPRGGARRRDRWRRHLPLRARAAAAVEVEVEVETLAPWLPPGPPTPVVQGSAPAHTADDVARDGPEHPGASAATSPALQPPSRPTRQPVEALVITPQMPVDQRGNRRRWRNRAAMLLVSAVVGVAAGLILGVLR